MVRWLRWLGAALVVLLLAACGSQLDPEEVARANGGGVAGSGGLPGQAPDAGVPAGTSTDPGAVGAGADPGAVGGVVTGGGATPGGTTGATGAGAATGGSGAGAGSGGSAGGKGSATGGVKAASCAGFANQKGITDKEITIANVSDISGPVPGIFESSQQATKAYVDYFNSQSSICGRKLALVNLDSRADAGADQASYVKACDVAFATVGSMSAFDSGGASTAASCGLPDIRTTIVNPERQACKTCFAAYAITTRLISDAAAKFLAGKYPTAVKNAAFLFVNAGAAPVNGKSLAAGYQKAGWKATMVQGIDVAEFNYAPYVQQMKDKGVKGVAYYGPYQFTVKLQKAMQQQGFKPDFYLQDPTIYDQRYVEQAGSVGDGSYVFSPIDMFENRKNAEIQLYLSYLQQAKPGAIPNYYGLFAWSASRLFVEKSLALGGKLSRQSLVGALEKTTSWNDNGAHVAMNVATAATPPCLKMLQLKGGKWSQVSPGNFICGRVVDSGVGG
ncbi:MAG TPA: ABC transporter substrate-binding protein [Nocardioides sp.]|nr:ABC transporter substrate-binding protein [Nocardioides sp.]